MTRWNGSGRFRQPSCVSSAGYSGTGTSSSANSSRNAPNHAVSGSPPSLRTNAVMSSCRIRANGTRSASGSSSNAERVTRSSNSRGEQQVPFLRTELHFAERLPARVAELRDAVQLRRELRPELAVSSFGCSSARSATDRAQSRSTERHSGAILRAAAQSGASSRSLFRLCRSKVFGAAGDPESDPRGRSGASSASLGRSTGPTLVGVPSSPDATRVTVRTCAWRCFPSDSVHLDAPTLGERRTATAGKRRCPGNRPNAGSARTSRWSNRRRDSRPARCRGVPPTAVRGGHSHRRGE